MTNLQALQSAVSYPISANAFSRVLLDRGLQAGEDYTGKQDAAKFQSFELAKADLYTELVTAANITEGGYSVSVSDRSNFISLASGIYSKYGEPLPVSIAVSSVEQVNYW